MVNETVTPRSVVTHPYFGLVVFVLMCWVLPQVGSAAMIVGCAGLFSALVAFNPEPFRTRQGSLITAKVFGAAMWCAAVAVLAAVLLGAIQN
jgi:hypothetical protein